MAIEVIMLACDGLTANPELLFFPCTNIITMGLFLVWWLFVAASLATSGSTSAASAASALASGVSAYASAFPALQTALSAALNSTGNNGTDSLLSTYTSSDISNYLLIYHFFGLLWTVNFIAGVSTVAVAGSICAWYFSCMPAEVEADPKMAALKYEKGRFVLLRSLWRAVRFHVGSIAAGSLMLAIIGMIRAVMLYVSYKLKDAAANNPAIKFILCCVNCCLWCIQKCVEVLTTNAYIYIALKGEGFCAAGGRVFGLIVAHGGVFVVVGTLGEVIMLLGKVLIACVSAWACYAILGSQAQFQAGGANEITSSWFVVLITLFFAFFIGSGFMNIFNLTVDAVLICYTTDIDENLGRNGGNQAYAVPIHMRADRMDFKARKEAKEKAASAAAATAGAAKPAATGGV